MTYKLALITGASSGIGAAYAREFAKQGTDLVLVARRKDLLDSMASELQTSYKVKVSVIAADLTKADAVSALLANLKKSKLEPDVLINNAGFGTSGRVQHEDRDRVREEINLNVATLVDLTTAMVPALVAKKQGAIINIASTAAFQPVPGMAVYAATKAFVLSFTSALWHELDGTGVKVLAVCPGATATEFFDVAGAHPFGKLASVSDVVSGTFKALRAKKPFVVIGSRNAVMAGFSSLLPKALVTKVAGSMFLDKK
ncbi:MAG: SDR family NAD(P)-dependent oxidoreductase [Micrococcales bacterium]